VKDPRDWEGRVYVGDCLDFMRSLPDVCVNCVVTSPPYWGLRSYAGEQEVVWGGDDGCEHEWGEEVPRVGNENRAGLAGSGTGYIGKPSSDGVRLAFAGSTSGSFCLRCGAWRGALGLEPTPGLYVEHIVQVFREVRRVLHPKGVCFLNLGDSYAGSGGAHANEVNPGISNSYNRNGVPHWGKLGQPGNYLAPVGLKAKDLCMMPARVALALQQPHLTCQGCGAENHASRWPTFPNGRRICPSCEKSKGAEISEPGWWLRSEITWCKLSPMPESVTDRPTSATEKVYLLAKGEDYWYDAEAVREVAITAGDNRGARKDSRRGTTMNSMSGVTGLSRNLRNYWVLGPEPMGWEMCRACHSVYSPKQHGRLPTLKVEKAYHAVCRCGRHDAWLSHFATFTPTLASRCILAGCPEKVCAVCGEPWRRRVEKSRTFESGSGRSGRDPVGKNGPHLQGGGETGDIRRGPVLHTSDLGIFPACECNGETTAGVAFDPFMGAGTVALAALKLGRSFLGCEISEEYVALAEARIAREREKLQLPLEATR